MWNEPLGWISMLAGLASGAIFGTGFLARGRFMDATGQEERLLRLAHVAFVVLGMMNVLFAASAPRLGLGPGWVLLAAWGLGLGAVTMPLCCLLAAWSRRLRGFFVVPVSCLLVGVGLVAWGLSPMPAPIR